MLYMVINMDPIKIPQMLACIYHTWILWVVNEIHGFYWILNTQQFMD